MNTEQLNDFYSQNSQQRYDTTIAAIKEQQQLWTLADDQGCVVLDTGKEQCLVMWHDEALAKNWASGEFERCEALAISLEDFMAKWVPGMSEDGFDVAIAPSLAGEGIVLSPQELATDLS
ncbi:DUF2750 domain-containing protein [Ferrimonas marina]|uniref:DUF2750 domain-containing protein n=1 Tax=Ferrimonas marina TaxID=299255 RepID=A0A1M5RI84_9GAMM|nr:DUF2750 domain-containing protein [Ferrimonas marina]SHH26005.1 Protein of unknown function [Ferrimonas marina]